jgi:hypothetical protein
MSSQTEVHRLGQLVLVRTDYDGEDRPQYTIYAPSRTDEHGCGGCWRDADGLGYCEETTWYSDLLGGRSYYESTNPQNRSVMEALMAELFSLLPPTVPPPPTESDHFM